MKMGLPGPRSVPYTSRSIDATSIAAFQAYSADLFHPPHQRLIYFIKSTRSQLKNHLFHPPHQSHYFMKRGRLKQQGIKFVNPTKLK